MTPKLLPLEPAAFTLGGSEWLLDADRVIRLLLANWSVKSATASFSSFSSSSAIIFEVELCANAEARGVAGVGVADQERGVGMDSISAVPDLDLLEAACRDEEGARDALVDTREPGRLFDEFEERELEELYANLDADRARSIELCKDEPVNKVRLVNKRQARKLNSQ